MFEGLTLFYRIMPCTVFIAKLKKNPGGPKLEWVLRIYIIDNSAMKQRRITLLLRLIQILSSYLCYPFPVLHILEYA